MRLLLIEDNFLFGNALTDHVISQGWSVHWKRNLTSGIAASSSNSYDVACLDRNLPDGDGFDFLRRTVTRYPVVVLSAFDQYSDRLEAQRLGAADYLVKPMDLHELVRRIELVSSKEKAAEVTAYRRYASHKR